MTDLSDRQVAHAWVIDGSKTIYVTHPGLDEAWAVLQGFVDTHAGLEPPDSMKAGIDPRGGDFEDSTFTFAVNDIDGTLPERFKSNTSGVPVLIDTIEPSDDPAPASVWGKHVGIEAIGPAGERRMYSCEPGFAVGLRHLGQNQAWALKHAATPVTDEPRIWVGRRWTCWRVEYEDGVWQNLDEASLAGFGTMMGQGPVSAERWTFKLNGPEGWASGNIGEGAMQLGHGCRPLLPVTQDDQNDPYKYTIRAALTAESFPLSTDPATHEWVEPWGTSTDLTGFTGNITYEDLVGVINDLLDTVQTDVSNGTAFNAQGSYLSFNTGYGADGFVVRWDRLNEPECGDLTDEASYRITVQLRIAMHEDLWGVLGYDPRAQRGVSPVDAPDQYCMFKAGGVESINKGKWIGHFFSADANGMMYQSTAGDPEVLPLADGLPNTSWPFSNHQSERRWPPIYSGGASVWTLKPGQEFQLSTAFEPVHFLGTKSRPLPAVPDTEPPGTSPFVISGGVGAVTHQGLIVVDGPYRSLNDLTDGPQDADEGYAFAIARERAEGKTKQVIRVGWAEAGDGSIALDDEDLPRLVVYHFEDPREWGFPYPPLKGTWAGWRNPPPGGAPMLARPLVPFEYSSGQGDRIDLIMLRALATTGTAGGWIDGDTLADTYGLLSPNPEIEPGDNDLSADVPIDAEVAQLGLGIPASRIASAAEWKAVAASVGPNLSRCKAVFGGGTSARALLASLMSPAGLCWSLAGGKFGICDPTVFPEPDLATAKVLTPESLAGEPGVPDSVRPDQEQREWQPIDLGEGSFRVDPIAGSFASKLELRATDLGAPTRSQTIKHKINGHHVAVVGLGSDWLGELRLRFDQLCEFWGRQHFAVEVDVQAKDHVDTWPGAPMLITDPWLVDPSGGEYGVTLAVGRFLSRDYRAADAIVRCRAIVNAETTIVLYAPAALGTAYNETTGEIGCPDDWLDCRTDGSVDVEGFAEAWWSDVGGTAGIEVIEFDAVTWERQGLVGEVVSVVTTPGSCKLVLSGPLTGGTWHRDMHHLIVLRKYADQAAAWVKAIHAPICIEDGTHSSGEDGVAFRD